MAGAQLGFDLFPGNAEPGIVFMGFQPPVQFSFLLRGQANLLGMERDIVPKILHQLKFFGGAELKYFLGYHGLSRMILS